jgi:multiple sugar transport system permease protein
MAMALPLKRTIFFILVAVILALSLFPVVYALFTSLKPSQELFTMPPRILPRQWTLAPYLYVFQHPEYLRYFLNSIVVAGGTTIVALVLASLAGYGFSRFWVPAKRTLLTMILLLEVFPGVILMTPYYRLAQVLHLHDTYIVLILIDSGFVLPISIWLLKNFFDTVPTSMEESAMVDGTTRLQALLYIIAPLARPGLVATAIMAFLNAWNEFMFALLLTSSPTVSPLTYGLASLFGQYNVQRNIVMAVTMLSVVPLFLVFVFLQRHLVRGIMGGSNK